MKPELSVVIVNWNTSQLLKKCIETLLDSVPDVDLEIIVVDNGSSDDSADMVRREFSDRVILIVNPENLGFSKGNNIGIRKANGRFILLLNTDAFVQRDSIKILLRYVQAHPDVGVVHPVLVSEQGEIQISAALAPPGVLSYFLQARFLGALRERMPFLNRLDVLLPLRDHNRTQEVFAGSFSCLLARREMFELVGLLDEHFFMYYEDWDWFCRSRLHKREYRIVLVTEARVVHVGAQSSSGDQKLLSRLQLSSELYFFRKHYGAVKASLHVICTILLSLLKVPMLFFISLVFRRSYYASRLQYQNNVLAFFWNKLKARLSRYFPLRGSHTCL